MLLHASSLEDMVFHFLIFDILGSAFVGKLGGRCCQARDLGVGKLLRLRRWGRLVDGDFD